MKRCAVFFFLVPLIVFAGTDEVAAQWVQTSLDTGYVRAFAVIGTNVFAGTVYEGVFRSTDNGTSWTVNGVDTCGAGIQSLAVSGTNLFAGTMGDLGFGCGVFLSSDSGTSWTAVNSGLPQYAAVRSLGVSGTNLFAGIDGGVFRSTNSGTSWTAVDSGFPPYAGVVDFAVSDTNLFAGASGDGVFLSTNSGTSWTVVNTGLTSIYVTALAVSGTNLFAGTPGGVFLSTNNGTNWTEASNGLLGYTAVTFAVNGTNVFAGMLPFFDSTGGVFVSTNNGTSWTAVNTGLTNLYVTALAVSGPQGAENLFAGTDGRGVWRRPLSEIVTSVDNSAAPLPSGFDLAQNYPNPFNPSTVIRYSLPVASHTTLKVYNVLGQEVATLVNEEMRPGNYELTWDATEMASGVYLYMLEAGQFVETKKLMLIR